MRIILVIVACLVAYPVGAQTDTGTTFRVHVINTVTGTTEAQIPAGDGPDGMVLLPEQVRTE